MILCFSIAFCWTGRKPYFSSHRLDIILRFKKCRFYSLHRFSSSITASHLVLKHLFLWPKTDQHFVAWQSATSMESSKLEKFQKKANFML
jgi:hypothetical protein